MQKEKDNSLRLITCCSCSLNETQNRYATIELERLGVLQNWLLAPELENGAPHHYPQDSKPRKPLRMPEHQLHLDKFQELGGSGAGKAAEQATAQPMPIWRDTKVWGGAYAG